MAHLIQSFYKHVHAICATNNESELMIYLSNDGLILLRQLLDVEFNTWFTLIQGRDFGQFLLTLIPHCYAHVSNDDAEQALHNMPPITPSFYQDRNDHTPNQPATVLNAIEGLFDTLTCLFDFHSDRETVAGSSTSTENNNSYIEIAQALASLALPPLSLESKVLWFYHRKLRCLLSILRQIFRFQSSALATDLRPNPISTLIGTIYQYLSSSSPTSYFLVRLAFDALQGFALLAESALGSMFQTNHHHHHTTRRPTADLLNLIIELITSDYFALFALLNHGPQNEHRAKQLLDHCGTILKRLKIYRCEHLQRRQHRRNIRTTYWENSIEQTYLLHQHQTHFEIMLQNNNTRITIENGTETRDDDEETNQIRRICVISAIYDKLLRLTVKQLESTQPSFNFVQDCLTILSSCGSCSCYSLSHYRFLLSKINHLKIEHKTTLHLEQQSIQLLRSAFLLLSTCTQRNHHYHDVQSPDNYPFWTYLASHILQRPSHYSFEFVRSLPDLVQCCSLNDKRLALIICLIPTLEYYRSNLFLDNENKNIFDFIEYLIRTLPCLLFDIIDNVPLINLSETLISLSSIRPSLLIHTLPVLGSILTSPSNSANIHISESFSRLILTLTDSWTISNDSNDNVCHILILLLQKSSIFRQTFFAHDCHRRLYDRFQRMLHQPSDSTIQSILIATILVAASYYSKQDDCKFNYKLIIEQLTIFSEQHRYEHSWLELLVRFSLSQQYQERRTRWKSSSTINRLHYRYEIKDNHGTTNTSEIETNTTDDEDEEMYQGDVESLSDRIPIQTMGKQNSMIYSNLIIFPDLIFLGLKLAWQNVDNQWSANPITPGKMISTHVTNLVGYLELLCSLVRANSYNSIVLKKFNIDEYLFHCLLTIARRSLFIQKDPLISLIITLLQFIWSQSITVHQLDQCFKLILTHRPLIIPLLRLFKYLVHQIDPNQPRSFCSMPLSSIVASKTGHTQRLTLDQLTSLRYPSMEIDETTMKYNQARQAAFVTETLKNIQFHFPLSVAIWLRINFPFDKHESVDDDSINEDENESIRQEKGPLLHILTLHHEGIQFQFWLDSKPCLCLKIVQLSSSSNNQLRPDIDLLRLRNLPRESWSHIFLTISKSSNTIRICLNGQTSMATSHPMLALNLLNPNKPWSISLGQQSLDVCTSFYYDLGSILLFDKADLSGGNNSDYVPTYLFSLGPDRWHFMTTGQQQQQQKQHQEQKQPLVDYWIYQRFTRIHSTISINIFEAEQNAWHSTLKRALIASYSSSYPWTLFLFNSIHDNNEDVSTSILRKLPFRSSPNTTQTSSTNISSSTTTDDATCIPTTLSLPSKISVEHSSNILNVCERLGGILNLIYLFAKIVELTFASPSSLSICHVADILFTSLWKMKSYFDLFHSLDGYHLIVKILSTQECSRTISQTFYTILLDKCLINQQRLIDIDLFISILLDWKIWRDHSEIFRHILQIFDNLLSDQINTKYCLVNRQLFKKHYALEHLLLICQEIVEEQQQQQQTQQLRIILDESMVCLIVNIIEALLENDCDTIASLMNFVLLSHPLVKTYVTYNKENFYFVVKPQRQLPVSPIIQLQTEDTHGVRPRCAKIIVQSSSIDLPDSSHPMTADTQNLGTSLNVRKSRSYSDLLNFSSSMMIENESHGGSRRVHHTTFTGLSPTMPLSATFPTDLISSSVNISSTAHHSIDLLSTGILRLLTNMALTASDRLMIKLIDHVFRLNILIVLLLDASMVKRVQCLKLLDTILKRMDKEKIQIDVLKCDLHTMLANQLYHQLDGRDDEKELVEICVSIALQRPVQFDRKMSLTDQIHDADQFYAILSSAPPCPRSQIGLTLVLALVEKLNVTNIDLCRIVLDLLNQFIIKSTDINLQFLVEIGLTEVLFNTFSSAKFHSNEKIILSIQKCFNSLICAMFASSSLTGDISFVSVMNNVIGMMNQDATVTSKDKAQFKIDRNIVHQTLSGMLNSIIDSTEKYHQHPLSTLKHASSEFSIHHALYSSNSSRTSTDDVLLGSTSDETCDRFRKFLNLALEYIQLFHHELILFETFILRLLDMCLNGMAYNLEKRPNGHRRQWSLLMFRCRDMIKQIALKLLTIALDPDKQRFLFRIQILKHIMQQPNAKAIMEYLFNNDVQQQIFHQILIDLQILNQISPMDIEIEQQQQQQNGMGINQIRNKKSVDSGHSTITGTTTRCISNGGDSSSHTVSIGSKHLKSTGKHRSTATAPSPSTEDEIVISRVSTPSSIGDEEDETRKRSDSSSSPSLSMSSMYSEMTTSLQQQQFSTNYRHIINSFRDLMRSLNPISSITNDANQAQRRALTEYLLTSSTSSQILRNSHPPRDSFDWPESEESQSTTNNPISTSDRNRHHSLSPSPVFVSWSSIVDEKRKEYNAALVQTMDSIQKRFFTVRKRSLQALTEVTITNITTRAMEITQDVINLQNSERKKFIEHLRLMQSVDLRTKYLWHQLIAQLTHEYGVWFEPASYPKFWELDPTETPQRERRRLQRSHCLMDKRFFQSQIPEETLVNPPLAYLFDCRHYQSINLQTVLYRNEKIEYQCRCLNVTPNNEIKGELLVGSTRIYFVADDQTIPYQTNKGVSSTTSTIGYHHSFNDDSNSFSFGIDDIREMHKRRYMLKDLALELFLINGITLMIAHMIQIDRDHFYRLLLKRNLINYRHGETLNDVQLAWKQGHMTNFEYLMQLNKLAGRTFLDLMQYPIYPYVVATYDTPVLDLRSSATYRDLSRPIAIQHQEKEERFIEAYQALQDSHERALSRQHEQQPLSPFGHQSDPYHFASLYSNSGIVLHYLVRLLPYTRMFLDYQDNNFDCADRTFHDVKTSYWLSSFESTSDFKELIPEFYFLHEFLLNKQGFNFGMRQNNEKVSDVNVPLWSERNARLFVCGLRQALESDNVTSHLHQWIDLIFGYKQTGKAALDAINVFHAACYYGFPIESIDDQLTQKAYYGIIRTYGQVPKKLFSQPHPPANTSTSSSSSSSTSNSNGSDKRNSERLVFEAKLPAESIHRHIIGVRWGDFVGSYDMASPDYISRHDCPVQVASFAVLNTGIGLICLPPSTLLFHFEQLSNESLRRTSTGEQPTVVHISQSNTSSSTSSDTMVALKWNTPDCIVRCRQLRQPKYWYNFLVPIDDQDKITCCASVDYRLLFVGKTSGLIEVYRIQRSKNAPSGIELIKRYLPFVAHRSAITCLHSNRQFSLLISASADGILTLWDTNRLCYVRTHKQDGQPIYHLTSSEVTGDIAYLSSSGSQWHLSYLTCNCDLIGCLTFIEQLNCLCFTSAPEGTCVNVLLGGFENGLISMWSTWDLTLLRQLDFVQLRSCPIIAICISKVDRRRLYVADRDRHLHLIESRVSSSFFAMQAPQVYFLS